MNSKNIGLCAGLLMVSLFLVSCLSSEQTSQAQGDLSCSDNCSAEKASSCEQLTSSDLDYIRQLEADAHDQSLTADGEFAADAGFNKIEELGRIGCASSASVLIPEGNRILSTATISSGGVYQFEYLGPRKLQAVAEALRFIPGDKKEIKPFLTTLATDSRTFGDGVNGKMIQSSAQASLDYLNAPSPQSIVSPFKRPMDFWNNPVLVCTSNFLKTDGSRFSFTANDYSSYELAWSGVAASSAELQSLAQEPYYCDGVDGVYFQSMALAKLSMPDGNAQGHLLISILRNWNYRGARIIPPLMYAMQKLALFYGHPVLDSTFDDDLAASALDKESPHADELARATAIEILSQRCMDGSATKHFCKDTLVPIAKHFSQKDLYYQVRFAAHRALKNGGN